MSIVITKSYNGELAERLPDFRDRGRKEAAQHRPPSDATSMDVHESELVSHADQALAAEQRLFDVQIAECSRAVIEIRQKGIEMGTKFVQASSSPSLLGLIDSQLATEHKELVAATEERLKREVDFRAFRAKHEISDQPEYPDSGIWHFAIVAVLALIETVVNAFFYENAQGLVGGFTVAIGVAIFNMGGAMLLGAGFRYKNLVEIDKRILGWTCAALFVVFALYCNAVFATFRSEYQLLTDPNDAAQLKQAFAVAAAEAKRVFWLDMKISDLLSFILFGIGLLLSLLAFYKGYTMDDRYPSHGRRHRRVVEADLLERKQQDAILQKIKDQLHAKRGEIQGLMHEPAQLINRAAGRVGDLQQAQASLRNRAQSIQRDFASVLRAYRDANTAVRASDAPPHFADVPDLTVRVSDANAEGILADLGAVQAEFEQVRVKYQEPLNAWLTVVQQDTQKILTDTYREFLAKVERDAKERIDQQVNVISRSR